MKRHPSNTSNNRSSAKATSPGSWGNQQTTAGDVAKNTASPPLLIPPTQPWEPRPRRSRRRGRGSSNPNSTSAPSSPSGTPMTSQLQRQRRQRSRSPNNFRPSSMPSYGSSGALGRLRRARRESESDEIASPDDGNALVSIRHRSTSIGSQLDGNRSKQSPSLGVGGILTRNRSISSASGGSSPRFGGLMRTNSNPFLQRPLDYVSSESLPLLAVQHQFGSNMSMSERSNRQQSESKASSVTSIQEESSNKLQAPPVTTHGHVERHMTLLDLIAVGVGGTLGTGVFVFSSVLTSSYAGPSSIFCWLLSAVPALLTGFCFAELSGQIPAAGSTYAYVYASMGELPAVVAAGCLSLEYVVSASAVARGWGDKMVAWMIGSKHHPAGLYNDQTAGWLPRILKPGLGFNTPAFLISACVAALLLGGVKESKAVTNYFFALKMVIVLTMILTGLGLMDAENLKPFLPSEFGVNGFFAGGTLSFMGFLGYDEVCCLTAEAIEPQRNMPRAILITIATLTTCYMGASLALSGMLPYNHINSVGGFPDAFEDRGIEWASTMASVGELVALPLVVLIAVMAQPRLQFALACDGLMHPWFGQVDEDGNMWNGTLFSGGVLALIASFVPLEYLNDLVSAGVLVAFSMANSSLLLLRHESPDDHPSLLERLVTWFNIASLLSSLCLTHLWVTMNGKVLTTLCCLWALTLCILIKLKCPAAAYFGGKSRRSTTQHMPLGKTAVVDESFRTPMLPFIPCVGIFINWYLVSQLPWNGLAFLVIFLSCAIAFYFSWGFFYSVGNNGGWDIYDSCGLSIHSGIHSIDDDWVDDDGYMFGDLSIHEEEAPESERSGSAEDLLLIEDSDEVQLSSNLASKSL